MNATEIALIAKHGDPSLSDAQAVIQCLRDGDLVHIDGAFMKALCSLSDEGVAVYGMCSIIKHEGAYHLRKDDRVTTEDNAIMAVRVAAGSTDNWWRAAVRDMAEMQGN